MVRFPIAAEAATLSEVEEERNEKTALCSSLKVTRRQIHDCSDLSVPVCGCYLEFGTRTATCRRYNRSHPRRRKLESESTADCSVALVWRQSDDEIHGWQQAVRGGIRWREYMGSK